MEELETDCNVSSDIQSNEMNISYSYVCPQPEQILNSKLSMNRNDIVSMKIKETADLFNIKLPEEKKKDDNDCDDNEDETWKSTRESDPLCEFSDMEELLTGAFPEVFLLGKAYSKKSMLSNAQIEHLLFQFTNAAATNCELLFYLYDCKSCHTVINNMVHKVKKDPKAFEEYAKLVRSDEFKEKVKAAAKDSNSKVAKEVLKTVLPIISLGGSNLLGAGLLGDNTSLSRGMAMAKRYGGASTLLTVTPDDINNPTTFRLACNRINNKDFPATVDEKFFESLRKGTEFVGENIKIPLNYTKRVQVATQNPVAVAEEFRSLIENTLSILIGCPLDFQPGNC